MGRAPCCDKANVKKGPWSPEEDAKLKDYIDKFGTGGNWIALPQKAGLKRCGKSCRLRWLNYLRPNIKHGEFSDEEDRIICTLYASIGSRWSIIAAQLPGRTDNDIKNYWNTKLKKKLMGLVPSNHTKFSPVPFQNPSTLSQLYRDYNSYFTHLANNNRSFSAINDPISTPQNFLYSNNGSSLLPLSTSTLYPLHSHQLDQEINFVGFQYKENMLMFGGNEASCSSSDGSISYGNRDHVKQENLQGFMSSGFDQENQKFMLHYGKEINGSDPLSEFLDQKPNVVMESSQLQYDLEEVKELISNSNFLVNNEENKTNETGLYYY